MLPQNFKEGYEPSVLPTKDLHGVDKCFRGTHIKTLTPKWHLGLQNAQHCASHTEGIQNIFVE